MFYPCKTLFNWRRSYDTMKALSKSFYRPLPHSPALLISHSYNDVSRMFNGPSIREM